MRPGWTCGISAGRNASRKGLKAIELASQAGDDQTEINARRSVIWALMRRG